MSKITAANRTQNPDKNSHTGDHIVGVLNQPPNEHISNEIIILEHTVRTEDRYQPGGRDFLPHRLYKLRRLRYWNLKT